MGLFVGSLQPDERCVGVPLCGRELDVAEQFLDLANIGPSVEQMGREGVTQTMGPDRTQQAGLEASVVHDATDGSDSEPSAAGIQEQRRLFVAWVFPP